MGLLLVATFLLPQTSQVIFVVSDLKPPPVNPRTIIWTTSAANLTVMSHTTQSVLKRKGLKKNLPPRLLKESVPSNSKNLPSCLLEESMPSCSHENCLVICPVCLDPILEATDETNGQEAIFCESICNSWLHKQCTGLSKSLFDRYVRTKGPFYCPCCRLITHDSILQELKTTVDNLTKEVTSLNATLATIMKSNSEVHSHSQPRQQQSTQQHLQQATPNIVKKDLPLRMLLQIPVDPVLRRIQIDIKKKTKSLILWFMGLKNVVKEHLSMKDSNMIKRKLTVNSIITGTESSISPLSIRDHL